MEGKKYKKLLWGREGDKALLIDSLKSGEVVISSTDTVYGLLGNITDKSYNRMLSLKQISKQRPFLVLIGSIESAFSFIERRSVSDRKLRFLFYCWPGPVTVIFRARKESPAIGIDGTVALRCPDHSGLLSILKMFDGLFSTSANRTSDPMPKSFSEISSDLLNQVPYVILDDEKEVFEGPSTIIDFSQELEHETLTIIREGAYKTETLQELYERSKN